MSLFFRSTATDAPLLELLGEFGATIERATVLLRDLLQDYPDRAHLGADLVATEKAADRLTHQILMRLGGAGEARSPAAPFEAHEGHRLATALDDIVDGAESVGDMLVVYGVEAAMEQADQLAETLVGAASAVSGALDALRRGDDLQPLLVEIHRLENEGDRQHRDAVASLFAAGIDPMVVIRWKDIFDALEATIDACETVAHELEGVVIKRRR